MKIMHLVFNEMRHRKLNTLSGILGVTIAAAVVIGTSALLTSHDIQTETILANKAAQVEARTKQYDDEVRKMTKKMGFNVVILPKDQDLTNLFTDQYASKFMPESYADKLANSKIVTVNHLLPSLEQKVKWPERNDRTMILIGIRGQVPIKHQDPKKPIMDTVPKGEMVLGHEIAKTENIKLGDKITFMGKTFMASKIHEPRGDKQDVTVWINLETAQTLLDKKGLINAIWALDCRCAWADLGKVRAEISAILPDTQILQDRTKALARAEARQAAIDEAAKALLEEKASRKALRDQHERFASILSPITIFAGVIWVGLIAFSNVRERKHELGVLRALGYHGWDIQKLFLAKAAGIGLVGALIGFGLGTLIGSSIETSALAVGNVISASQLGVLLGGAVGLTIVASWIPAQLASQQDPAAVLREE